MICELVAVRLLPGSQLLFGQLLNCELGCAPIIRLVLTANGRANKMPTHNPCFPFPRTQAGIEERQRPVSRAGDLPFGSFRGHPDQVCPPAFRGGSHSEGRRGRNRSRQAGSRQEAGRRRRRQPGGPAIPAQQGERPRSTPQGYPPFTPSAPVQRRLQCPRAKSKFLAVISDFPIK